MENGVNSLQTILRDLKEGRISKAQAKRRLETAQPVQVQLFHANWRARPTLPPLGQQGERVLLVCDRLGRLPNAISLTLGEGDAATRFETCALQLQLLIQSLLERASGPIRLQVAIPEDDVALFGLSAMLRTAQLEDPRLHTQLVGLEVGMDLQALLDVEHGQADALLCYRAGQRLVMDVEPVQSAPALHP